MTDFVDTNVLVYSVDDRDPDKRRASLAIMAAEPRDLAISGQVLGEFFVTITRRLPRPMSHRSAAQLVETLYPICRTGVDTTLVAAAIDTSDRHQLSYWDALIIEAAVRARCERLLTEDLTDGQTINGVRIVNPFG